MRLAFRDCVLDTDRRQLERRGQAVHLAPRIYRLLELLVERRPAAISKQELQEAVWPDVFVAESSLTNAVTQLRQALGDDARKPRLVRTVHGFGYSFEETVEERSDRPQRRSAFLCRLLLGDREIELESTETILGRAGDADVRISDENVSRRHARVVLHATGARLEDLDSRNGTYLQGRRLGGPVELADGDEIRVGDTRLVVRLVATDKSTVTRIDTRVR